MKDILKRARTFAAEAAAETLWPTRCAVCDTPGEVLCDACTAKLRFIDACNACPICGAPYGRIQCTECNNTMMASMGRDSLPMDRMAHCVILDDRSRRVVTAYKDHGEQRLAKTIAEYISRYIPPEWRMEGACITYIPATKAALARRGFDHMGKVARELSQITGLREMALFTPPASKDQRKLSRRKRVENMGSTMSLLPGCSVPRECIVIDDVCTTGSTLFAASDALKDGGCEKIYALTFARVLDI